MDNLYSQVLERKDFKNYNFEFIHQPTHFLLKLVFCGKILAYMVHEENGNEDESLIALLDNGQYLHFYHNKTNNMGTYRYYYTFHEIENDSEVNFELKAYAQEEVDWYPN